ncbi:hypothetical protein BRC81_11160 [Halobacteriales archaeon QS_1_68_20]|nr:MAG: hypothetical protein BRC81_11160 [Halobacteriales archaeon QS_1_68_20]
MPVCRVVWSVTAPGSRPRSGVSSPTLIYEDRTERLEAIGPFLRRGLEQGQRCMYVVDTLTEEELVSSLREADVDIDAAIESGQLSFHTVEETYLRNGSFEPDEMIEFYGDAVERATEAYGTLRVVAETAWLTEEATSVEQFLEYEAKVNDLFDEEDCLGLCLYDRTAFSPEVVRDIIRTHPPSSPTGPSAPTITTRHRRRISATTWTARSIRCRTRW